MSRRCVAGLALLCALAATGCEQPADDAPPPADDSPTPTATQAPSTAAPTPAPTAAPTTAALGTVPPAWLGTRPLPPGVDGLGQIQPTPPELTDRRFTLPDQLDELPGDGFASRVDAVPAGVLARSTWDAKCPVPADGLRWVRLTFWGFDGQRHTGELLVNADAADAMVAVFRRLWDARYPIEEMRITRAAELDAEPTGDGNNTGAFTCRPLRGTTTWSEHAYGRAIDVNPFLNPYIKGNVLIPELASAYTDRGRSGAGIIRPGDAVTQAFASVGWGWGGAWQRSKDYMHFSANGR